MQVSGLFAVSPRGGKQLLFLTRADAPKVQSLQLNATSVALSGGRIVLRPFSTPEEKENRGVRLVVEGECAAGTYCTAVLVLWLDRNRKLTFNVRGLFDRNKNILFYQELPPAAATFEEGALDLQQIVGLDVSVEKSRLEYVERG
jgi:hypothetical protein